MKISDKLKSVFDSVWVFLKIVALGAFLFLIGWTINRFKKKKEDFKKELKEIEKKIKEQEKKAKEYEKKRKEIEKELAARKAEAEKNYLKKEGK